MFFFEKDRHRNAAEFTMKNVVIIHLMIDLQSKSPCSVRMQENTDQKNSEYGQFLGSGNLQ